MEAYSGNIEQETLDNVFFRKVLFTGKHSQLVVMCINPGEDIGDEMHKSVDQFFRIEKGNAKFIFNEKDVIIEGNGEAVVVPSGTFHNVINLSNSKPLKLYAVYSPPNHRPNTIHKTKADALADKHDHA